MGFLGYNQDITVDGKKYHVQTQALGDTGVVVTQIFEEGKVYSTDKQNYSEYIENRTPEQQASNLNPLIQLQHRKWIRELPGLVTRDLESTVTGNGHKPEPKIVLSEEQAIAVFLGDWAVEK